MRPWIALFTALALHLAPASTSFAGSPPSLPSPSGPTLEGDLFTLSQLRGKVVLLMYWSTDCAVCRDKMHELRDNAQGWAHKPFQLVLVNTDRRLTDLVDYERIVMRTLPGQSRFVRMWAGHPQFQDRLPRPNRLPASYLIDTQGRVVEQFIGRIPSEAWDRIADLL